MEGDTSWVSGNCVGCVLHAKEGVNVKKLAGHNFGMGRDREFWLDMLVGDMWG